MDYGPLRGLFMADKKSFSVVILICTIMAVMVLGGCVERKLTINTEPQGALISLNDEEIGTSPVTVAFDWYGDYRIRATKEGYTILNTHRNLKAPAHDGFPMDFIAGVLYPGQITDEYEWTFPLDEYQIPDRNQLIKDSQEFKIQALDIDADPIGKK